jgi:DNA (cytosine-5)-methyltransferase 1
MELRVNDLFCGAGGMGLGFKQAGFRLAGAWDFDKWAVESYGHNVSPKVKQADITQMEWNELPYADVWTFGFPCQDISVAGKGAGMVKGETRSGLFYEVMRLLEETKKNDPNRLPKIILAENVKALKKYLPAIEEEYTERGYNMYYTLYNSKYWGVPQNRERYFVVGVHHSIEKEFTFAEQQTEFVPKLSSILETDVDEKYYIDDEKAIKIIEQAKEGLKVKQATKKGYDIAVEGDAINISHPNSTTRRGRVGKQVAQTLMTSCEQVVVEKTDLHGIIADPSQAKREGKHRIYSETSPTLAARDYKEPRLTVIGMLDMKGQENIRRVYDTEGLSPTLTTSEGGHRQPKVVEGYRVRKLTSREYARLQGFPESFQFVVSNSQLYKQFGNAVTVNVSRAIAEQIKEFLSNK